MKVLRHIVVTLLALFLTLGLPFLHYCDLGALFGGQADAVSGATMVLPDTPSGSFLVFIRRDAHPDTLDQWESFFREEDYGVLLEDVRCMVIAGDATGLQLAQRYQARLVKDQLTLRQDNGVMVASRLEQGKFDMVIVSKEAAQLWRLDGAAPPGAAVITVQGGTP